MASGSRSVSAGAATLTRLVAAMSPRHTSVDKDFATTSRIPRSNVQTSFLKLASSVFHPVPGHDVLLLKRDKARDPGVEGRGGGVGRTPLCIS